MLTPESNSSTPTWEALMNRIIRLCKSSLFMALGLCVMPGSIQPTMGQVLLTDHTTGCILGTNDNQGAEALCSQLERARARTKAVHRVVNLYWQAISRALIGTTGQNHLLGIAFDNDPTAPWNGPLPVVVFESGYNTGPNRQTVRSTVVNGQTFEQAVAALGHTVQFAEEP